MHETITTEDELITVETTVTRRPKRIPWQSILDACRLHEDSDYDPFDCDGLEHMIYSRSGHVYRRRRDIEERTAPDDMEMSEMQGGHYGDREQCAVVTTRAMARKWGTYDGARSSGASRGVAYELEACYIRQNVEYVRKLYVDGPEAYGVTCELYGCESSCWGLSPYEYATTVGREEIASDVAHQLEKAGFIVTGRPKPVSTTIAYYKATDGVNSQNWTGKIGGRIPRRLRWKFRLAKIKAAKAVMKAKGIV